MSDGCTNCYAARESLGRLSAHPLYAGLAVRHDDGNARFTGEVRLAPERLDDPLRWQAPARVFVNSMSDLWHPEVPDEFVDEVFARMALAPRHTFQVLTKRPARAAAWFAGRVATGGARGHVLDRAALIHESAGHRRQLARHEVPHPSGAVWPLPNVHVGTSIESARYMFRVEHLARVPAAVRFLSCEPLLGSLLGTSFPVDDVLDGRPARTDSVEDLAALWQTAGVGWVIAGGETGPRCRPTHPAWFREIRDAGALAEIPFHFKQHGEWIEEPGGASLALHLSADFIRDPKRLALHRAGMTALTPENQHHPIPLGHPGWTTMLRIGKRAAGRRLDGRTHDDQP